MCGKTRAHFCKTTPITKAVRQDITFPLSREFCSCTGDKCLPINAAHGMRGRRIGQVVRIGTKSSQTTLTHKNWSRTGYGQRGGVAHRKDLKKGRSVPISFARQQYDARPGMRSWHLRQHGLGVCGRPRV